MPSLSGSALRPLDRHLRARRHEPGKALGSGVDELFVADRPAQVVGQRGVDRVGVGAQEPRARGVERRLEEGRRFGLGARSGRRGPAGVPSSSSPRARYAHVAALAGSKPAAASGSLARQAVDLGRREARRFEDRARRQASASRNSAARSPIMIDGAFVLPVVTIGMIDASATRRPSMPCTRSRGSTTAAASVPILHVPTWWW